MSLNRDAFFAKTDLPREEVEVPALGGSVFVRSMTAGELDAWLAVHEKQKTADFRARLVAATACDETGAPLFTADDVPGLSALPAAVLSPLVDPAIRLNGLGEDAREEARKN